VRPFLGRGCCNGFAKEPYYFAADTFSSPNQVLAITDESELTSPEKESHINSEAKKNLK